MPRKKERESGRTGGRAGRRGRATPKGRQVTDAALAEVRAVLGDRPRRRDLLLEHLHLLHDRFHHLGAAHLAALATEMRLSMTEVFEVATFYAHLDVVKEGETPPPPLTVRVCEGVSCALRGSEALAEELEARLPVDRVRVVRAPCMGRCDRAPSVAVGRHAVDRAGPERVVRAVADGRTEPDVPEFRDLEAYERDGGYAVLRSCLSGGRTRDAVVAELEDSRLRGLGGAGFPAGRKWKFVLHEPKPRHFVLNADEGEPGTFKDRYFLEREPHRVLEGMLIAGWAIEADALWIYLRDEYPAVRAILRGEIAKLEATGLVGPGTIHLRRGAGAYICGEESALLESLEGKRGLPRHRPPYPAQRGLFNRPTLIHNVETMYWIPDILEKGAAWFSSHGRRGHQGLRAFSVSGRVMEPGVKIAPVGITARELIEEYCGGMEPGHGFRGYLPGGASGGILPASLADLPLDFGALEENGCFIGSAAIVVFSDRDRARDIACNILRFFEDESCGQCTPCRLGTEKARQLMERPSWDAPLLEELSRAMADASICGLGQAAPNPIRCVLRHFPGEAAGGSGVDG